LTAQKSKLEVEAVVSFMSRYVTVLAIVPMTVHGVTLIGRSQSLKIGQPHKYGKLNNMKQTTLEKIACGLFLVIATSVLLVALYYFIKAIVGFDN
jgi:hypothetical protein